MAQWFTGSGYEIKFDRIIELIEEHTRNNGSVFIGTDSFLAKKQCTFATVICFHGANGQSGGNYYVTRTKTSSRQFKVLLNRILSEVEKTVYLAIEVSNLCPEARIELHIDVSAAGTNTATGKFADVLTGYAKSAGFSCKIKPNSWAAFAIADKHSK
jgi:predicted RNase H-related nuclease YkuK (DUF458 family)